MSYPITKSDEKIMTTSLHLTGNIVPDIWLQRLVHEKSKNPHWLAVWILSDVCYWYSPTEVRDERTGAVKGYAKKYKGDYLQRSYSDIMTRTACEKKQAQRACKFLEDSGLIKLHFRTLTIGGVKCANVMYIEPKIDAIRALTYGEVWTSVGGGMDTYVHTYEHASPDGMDTYVHTNTVNTTITNPEREETPPPAPNLPPTKQAKQPERPNHFDNLAAQWRGSDNSESVAELMLSLRKATNSMAYAQLQKAADTLDNIGITAEQVTTLYTGANCWWYRCDWRGKKGDKPNTTNILETALTGVEWLTNGGAAETERATEAAALYREWIAPLAGMNGTASAFFKSAPPKVKAALRDGGGLGTVEQFKRVSEAEFAGWYAGVK